MPATAAHTTPASRYLNCTPRLAPHQTAPLAALLVVLHHAYLDLPIEVQSAYRQAIAELG